MENSTVAPFTLLFVVIRLRKMTCFNYKREKKKKTQKLQKGLWKKTDFVKLLKGTIGSTVLRF